MYLDLKDTSEEWHSQMDAAFYLSITMGVCIIFFTGVLFVMIIPILFKRNKIA